jgi:secreted trypsin-like serine protease
MLKSVRHAALLLALGLAPHPAAAIVGESVDGQAYAPQMVMVLTTSNKGAGICSAVVITQQSLLSAGHCVAAAKDTLMLPRREGVPDTFEPVKGIAIHPQYKQQAFRTREKSVDLALIRLERPLPQSYVPARLSTRSHVIAGELFDLVGFGLTKENDGKTSGRLLSAKMAARDPTAKLLLWIVDPKKRGTGACTGDSGGGIFAPLTNELIATTVWSEGEGKAHCGSLTQGVLVASQRDWIEQTLRKWGDALP